MKPGGRLNISDSAFLVNCSMYSPPRTRWPQDRADPGFVYTCGVRRCPQIICFPDAPPPWEKGFEIPILRSLRELIRGQSDRQARPICGHRPAGPGPAGARRVTQSRKWAQVIRGQNRSQTLAKFFREQRGRRRERGQRGGSYLFFSSPEEALLALIFWAINWARLSFLSDRCQLCP